MITQKVNQKAFKYLIEKQGSKGKQNTYQESQMCEYLLPGDNNLSISDKRNMFSIRNRMVNIFSNFPYKQELDENCVCGETETMEHIYTCTKLNSDKIILPYSYIHTGNVTQQIIVYKRFKQSYERREEIKNQKDKMKPSCAKLS